MNRDEYITGVSKALGIAAERDAQPMPDVITAMLACLPENTATDTALLTIGALMATAALKAGHYDSNRSVVLAGMMSTYAGIMIRENTSTPEEKARAN